MVLLRSSLQKEMNKGTKRTKGPGISKSLLFHGNLLWRPEDCLREIARCLCSALFTLPKASVVSRCWRPWIGEPCLTCCICSFMLCKVLFFPGSDLLKDSSTANGVSSDLQLFCISKNGLSSKPGSIRNDISKDLRMKWEHYLQSLIGFFGTKKAAWTPFGLCFIRWNHRIKLAWRCPVLGPPQVCPTGSTCLLHHWRNWGSTGRCLRELAAWKRQALTPPAVQAGWEDARGEPGERARFVTVGAPAVSLPVPPLSSPNLL